MSTPLRRVGSTMLGMAVAADAHASYADGALGVLVLLIAVPVGLLLLLVALVMRATDAFDDAELGRKCRRSGFVLALIPVVLAGIVDPTSAAMVLAAAAVFMLAVIAVTRPWPRPASGVRSGQEDGDGAGEPAQRGPR